jgi:hypothetical protein
MDTGLDYFLLGRYFLIFCVYKLFNHPVFMSDVLNYQALLSIFKDVWFLKHLRLKPSDIACLLQVFAIEVE